MFRAHGACCQVPDVSVIRGVGKLLRFFLALNQSHTGVGGRFSETAMESNLKRKELISCSCKIGKIALRDPQSFDSQKCWVSTLLLPPEGLGCVLLNAAMNAHSLSASVIYFSRPSHRER